MAVFGRTNIEVADMWLRPVASEDPQSLARAVFESGLPLDLSSQPALWGGILRNEPGFESRFVVGRSSTDFEKATDESHAVHLVHAHLIEVLSSLGRPMLDVYFVRIRRGLEEFQINGVIQALEMAREDGLIRFAGLFAEGPSLVVRSIWQFHDAFECALLPEGSDGDELVPLADQRRVGVVRSESGPTRLVTVRTVAEVEAAVGSRRI